MKIIPMNLLIDRRLTDGTAIIQGSVNGEKVRVQVDRGVHDGNAYVQGSVGQDAVAMTFTRTAANGYEQLEGSYGQHRLDAGLQRYQPDGDTGVTQNGQSLLIDRQHQGRRVALHSTVVEGGFERQLRDGDELGQMAIPGQPRLEYTLDRDEHHGGFLLSGRAGRSSFRLEASRSPSDGDLSLRGTVPEGLTLFPLLWEVLGDDKNVRDNNPEYPGAVMAMSMFLTDPSSSPREA